MTKATDTKAARRTTTPRERALERVGVLDRRIGKLEAKLEASRAEADVLRGDLAAARERRAHAANDPDLTDADRVELDVVDADVTDPEPVDAG